MVATGPPPYDIRWVQVPFHHGKGNVASVGFIYFIGSSKQGLGRRSSSSSSSSSLTLQQGHCLECYSDASGVQRDSKNCCCSIDWSSVAYASDSGQAEKLSEARRSEDRPWPHSAAQLQCCEPGDVAVATTCWISIRSAMMHCPARDNLPFPYSGVAWPSPGHRSRTAGYGLGGAASTKLMTDVCQMDSILRAHRLARAVIVHPDHAARIE
ncbi:hypothetical protein BASA62_007612 [Batrachochytrium salamandrivorans]|nr:hypothetical protein BASA62_007612 [Batrachochytrium salamandrivorans]